MTILPTSRVRAYALLSVLAGSSIAFGVLRATEQQPLVGTLLSVSLSPATPTRTVGQQAAFGVTGVFEGGTRILGGNDSSLWSFILTPTMAVSQCSTTPVMFGGQVISVQPDGAFNELWSPMTPIVRAIGTLTPSGVHVDLSCADQAINPIVGSMDLAWTGTQYDGTYAFADTGIAELAGLTWTSSDPDVATVNQRGRATAIAPGTTTITATYGRTCWPADPQPAGGCRGTVSGSAVLTVVDAPCAPPSITSQQVSPSMLWPPNHRMVDVAVTTAASSPCQQPINCTIQSISSNEPVDGLGDGDMAPDWELTGPMTARVRAERSGLGSGRVYTIVTACSNNSGSATRASIVTVPFSR